jgi:type IV pilus assembly protein PilW
MKSITGFTLIEVLIAMFVSLVIMGGAYTVFSSYQKNTTVQTNVSDAQQTLRAAMDYVARDIRMAGYDPRGTGMFGIDDISSLTLDGNTVSRIKFSWDKYNSVDDVYGDGKFEDDWNLTPDIQPEEAEQVEYSLVNNSTITDGVNDLYLKYPNAADSDREVLAANIISIGFAYAYDADDDGELDRDVATGNILWVNAGIDPQDIRAVRISMLSQSQAPDPNYTDTNTYIVGPHSVTPNNNFRHRMLERTVLCRNMGLNL